MQRNYLFNDNASTTNISAEDAAVLKKRIDDLNSSLTDLKNKLCDVFYKEEDEGRTLHPFLPVPGAENLEFRIKTQEGYLVTLQRMLRNEPVTDKEQQDLLKMDVFHTLVSSYSNVVKANNTPKN